MRARASVRLRAAALGATALLGAWLVAGTAPTARAVQPAPTTASRAPGTTPSSDSPEPGATASASAPGIPAPASGLTSPPVGGAGLAGPGVLVNRSSGVPAPPAMAAASYLVADLDSGDVLVAKEPHALHLPASTLKTLTALTVIPLLDPLQVVTAEPSDVVDGSLVGLVPGLTYTVHQLLQGMMLSSGNDAATALARVAGGPRGVAGTVEAMQQTAQHLGARDTVVRDPSGLDAPGQVTSAYDLALIARAALQNPQFESLVATKRARFPGKPVPPKASASATRVPTVGSSPNASPSSAPKRATFQIQNHNTLLYNYDGAIGVKNGYTVAARWTIVGAAERNGHRYVVTALKRSDRSWRPTAALLDWAFRYGPTVQPVGRLVPPGELERTADQQPPTATALAAGSAAGVLGRSPSHRWVGAVGLVGAALLLVLLALRARRTRLATVRTWEDEPRRVSDPGQRP